MQQLSQGKMLTNMAFEIVNVHNYSHISKIVYTQKEICIHAYAEMRVKKWKK